MVCQRERGRTSHREQGHLIWALEEELPRWFLEEMLNPVPTLFGRNGPRMYVCLGLFPFDCEFLDIIFFVIFDNHVPDLNCFMIFLNLTTKSINGGYLKVHTIQKYIVFCKS